MNLIINATEAIAGEGTVTVTTSNNDINKLNNDDHNLKEGEYLCVRIHDTGSGISHNDLEHIFEPFYSKKTMGRSGTGLGLSIVWNVVQEHQGKIDVNSSKDHGTSFQMYFPVSHKKEIFKKEPDIKEQLTGNNERILVIDDEPHLRDIACQMLQSIGYKTDAVSSGESAIEYVKKHKVDLIVIDMLMDPGINGYQTYEQIIKIRPGQKAIIASGYSESNDVKKTLRLGAGDFIKKPYSIDQLARIVKKVLG